MIQLVTKEVRNAPEVRSVMWGIISYCCLTEQQSV